jgi:putative ABC transport system permease protein
MSLAGNLKFTLRTLGRNPALAISAILAGLGIGATSAMFSITDGILLHPLPFPKSNRLVNVWDTAAAQYSAHGGGAAASVRDCHSSSTGPTNSCN